MRFWLLPIAVGLLATPRVAGQASPYIRLDHWAMPALEHLVATDVIKDPTPFERPWREAAIARALAGADTTRASAAVRQTIRDLRRQFAPSPPPRVYIEAYAGLHAESDARRDVLRPAGGGFAGFLGGVHGTVTAGPVVLSTHPYTDRRIRFDPEYTGVRDETIPGRLTDAYVSLESPYAELVVGAVDREWGLPREQGFLVSAAAYSYDHLFASVGPRAIRAEVLYTQLDDFLRPPDGATIKRHWAVLRVVFVPSDRVQFSVGQATLWLGAGRGFEWRFLNPLRLTTMTLQDESVPDSINGLYEGNFRIRLHRRLAISGALMVDDLASGIGTSTAPDRGGASLALSSAVGGVGVEIHATSVTAPAYRSQQGPEFAITRNNVGLGRNFADNLELGLLTSVMPASGLTLSPQINLLWQGEGDPRQPLALGDPTLVALFQGVTSRTLRTGVGVHLAGDGPFALDGSVGLNRTWDAGHVDGATRWDLVVGLRAVVWMGWRATLRASDVP